jgi:hypothetical protein
MSHSTASDGAWQSGPNRCRLEESELVEDRKTPSSLLDGESDWRLTAPAPPDPRQTPSSLLDGESDWQLTAPAPRDPRQTPSRLLDGELDWQLTAPASHDPRQTPSSSLDGESDSVRSGFGVRVIMLAHSASTTWELSAHGSAALSHQSRSPSSKLEGVRSGGREVRGC